MLSDPLSVELLAVLGITLAAVILFVSEWVPPALVALGVMSSLLVSGILEPAEGFAGFSDSATLTVAALFVLSAGLEATGAVKRVGERISGLLSRHPKLGYVALLVGVAGASGFINNTAVVAVMIPVIIGASRDADVSPSRLLMPLSFASMLGGVCTLMGTSTNLLISSIVEDDGRAPLGFFEMLPLGAILLAFGLVYLGVIHRFLPERRRESDLRESFALGEFFTRLTIREGAPMAGRRFADSALAEADIEVLSLERGGEVLSVSRDTELRAQDTLRVQGPRDVIASLEDEEDLAVGLTDLSDLEFEDAERMLLEVVVSPRSSIAGKALREVELRERFGARMLALRRFGELEHQNLADKNLVSGDVLLLLIPRERRRELERARDFLVLEGERLDTPALRKMWLAVAIVAAVVVLAASDVIPVVVGAPVGAVLMVVLGCLRLDRAYHSIDWDVVFLLAGMLALGEAFVATGATTLLSQLFVEVHSLGPHLLVGAIYLVTLLLTSTMSNQATAALLTPIALSAATTLDVSARPLVLAVAFAASSSFLTPVGYQTNTMVYGAGHYRFTDFVKIGTPLSLALCGLAAWLIPWLWPL